MAAAVIVPVLRGMKDVVQVSRARYAEPSQHLVIERSARRISASSVGCAAG